MNNTELFINLFYESIGVTRYNQLSIESISENLNLDVHYWDYTSELVSYRNKYKIFINNQLTSQKQWQDFGHEMCHFAWHHGSQDFLKETYQEYQEFKADYFMYHFCAPSFMLEQHEVVSVYDIMNLFNVDFNFAIRRLDMHESKMLSKNMIFVM